LCFAKEAKRASKLKRYHLSSSGYAIIVSQVVQANEENAGEQKEAFYRWKHNYRFKTHHPPCLPLTVLGPEHSNFM